MLTYATVQDVAARIGRPIVAEAEIAQVTAWLEDVETEIAARFRRAGLDLASQVATGDPDVAMIVRVEASAVARRVQNPQPGRTSTTRSIDDGSTTDRWESGIDPWAITDAEWDLLLSAGAPQAFSTRLRYTPDRRGLRTPWGRP